MKKIKVIILLLTLLVALENCQPNTDNETCLAFVRKDNWCNEFDTLNYLSYKINYSGYTFYNKGRSLMSDSMAIISRDQREDTLVIGFMHFRDSFWSPFYEMPYNLYYLKDTIVKADLFPCCSNRVSPLVGKTNAQLILLEKEEYENYVKTIYHIASPHFKNNWRKFHKGY